MLRPLLIGATGAALLFVPLASSAPAAPAPAHEAAGGAYVACIVFIQQNADEELLRHPSRCHFSVQNGTPGGIFIRRMHWHRWGHAATTTTGQFVGNMNYRARAHVKLYRLRPCTGYGSIYTRMRLRTGTTTWQTVKLEHCGG